MSDNRLPERLRGLDSLRFLAALMVAFSHGLAPPLLSGAPDEGLWALLQDIYRHLFPGQAAVILFFVISGFCIHWPQATGAALDVRGFLIRRLLRLCLPLLAALALVFALQMPLVPFNRATLWSLFAEVIYYLLYPALLRVRQRFGWWPLFVFAYSGALMINLGNPFAYNFQANGHLWTWWLGLPCWLLGCCLAERIAQRPPAAKVQRLWLARLGLVLLLALIGYLKWNTLIRNPWSLQVFALYATFWLAQEIVWWRQRKPWLEGLGLAAYSLYLMNRPANYLVEQLWANSVAAWSQWLVKAAAVALLTLLFYLLVERPSHQLARRITQRPADR